MRAQIIAISDSDKHFSTAIEEYKKRMEKKLTIMNIKPIKHGTQSQIIAKETDLMIKKIEQLRSKASSANRDNHKIILLSKDGISASTEKRTSKTSNRGAITCIIGGPYGLDEGRLQQYIDASRSFGQHTMPHGLVKLIVLEQLYRLQTIFDGKKYHY